jgi:hypothetical protein
LVEKEHTYAAHKRRVDELYDWLEEQINTPAASATAIEPCRESQLS